MPICHSADVCIALSCFSFCAVVAGHGRPLLREAMRTAAENHQGIHHGKHSMVCVCVCVCLCLCLCALRVGWLCGLPCTLRLCATFSQHHLPPPFPLTFVLHLSPHVSLPFPSTRTRGRSSSKTIQLMVPKVRCCVVQQQQQQQQRRHW